MGHLWNFAQILFRIVNYSYIAGWKIGPTLYGGSVVSATYKIVPPLGECWKPNSIQWEVICRCVIPGLPPDFWASRMYKEETEMP